MQLKFLDTASQGAISEADHWLRAVWTVSFLIRLPHMCLFQTAPLTDFPDPVELVFAVDHVITAAIRRAEDAFYRTV